MPNNAHSIPVVLSFSCNDPSGGGGIHADIEAMGSMGCHCAPVITSLLANDTNQVHQFFPMTSNFVITQARSILEDMPVSGFKVGLVGSLENIQAIHTILKDYPNLPVVLDPALRVHLNNNFMDPDLIDAIVALLLPLTTICKANVEEARLLAPEADSIDACAQEIMAHGAKQVLITGSKKNSKSRTNLFFGNYRQLESFTWDAIPQTFNGSSCTLSASMAALLAQGLDPMSAVHEAQEYTWESLKHGHRLGMGLHQPNRLFWARETQLEYDITS